MRFHPNKKYRVIGLVLLIGGLAMTSLIYFYLDAYLTFGAKYNAAPPDNVWMVLGTLATSLVGLLLVGKGMHLTFFLSVPEDEMMVAP